jgi:hypothetical protein
LPSTEKTWGPECYCSARADRKGEELAIDKSTKAEYKTLQARSKNSFVFSNLPAARSSPVTAPPF